MTPSSLTAGPSMVRPPRSVGELLRQWRQRRGLRQLGLACAADISTRHLSFLETGRALPSREMILRLAEQLQVPFRERNVLLTAAGYAPVFTERPLDHPALEAAHSAVSRILLGHEPYPAVAIDHHWRMVASNRAIAALVTGADARLLDPPVNVLRLGLHPRGIASRILNFSEWRSHLLSRLRHQIEVTGDLFLVELMKEISCYESPAGAGRVPAPVDDLSSVVVPLRLLTDTGILNLVSTTTLFGTPLDITLAEIAIESFFPADAATAEALQRLGKRS
jgi:transcriptional regulator with XRE-family HTH domain